MRYLPDLLSARRIGAYGLSEPGAGSDAGGLKTTARRDGDAYVIDGAKTFITNAPIADVFVVWAKLPDDNGEDQIRGFILEKGWKGLSAPAIHGKVGLRTSITGEIVLDEVFVPEENLMPDVRGLKGPFTCLNSARYGIAWGVMGAARDSFDAALAYSLERTPFGRPLAGFQLTQQKLADMAVEINKGTLLALHLGRLKDAGKLQPHQISLAKLSNTREAIEIARSARTVLGGNGILLEYSPIRHANNLESVRTYEGTDEVHTLVLGQHITGISAFR